MKMKSLLLRNGEINASFRILAVLFKVMYKTSAKIIDVTYHALKVILE